MKETFAFQITALYREFFAYSTARLKALGVSFGQLPLILYVGKHPGCAQADLTAGLKLDWGYSQRTVARLVDSGLMRKEYDEKSACNCLKLTGRGQQAFDVSHRVFSSWDEAKLDGFSEEETKTLRALLGKLAAQGTSEK